MASTWSASRPRPDHSVDRRQRHPQSVLRLRDRPHLPVWCGAGRQRDAEILQEMPGKTLRLHVGKMQPKAHMRAATERHPGEAMAGALRLVGKSQGIECLGVGPYFRHVMGEQRIYPDQ